MHFIYFLGRFHVLAVHLPITLVLVVAALEWLTRGGRRPDLQAALGMAWAATALTAVLTAILGYMHFTEGGFQGPIAQAHRALGTSIAVISLAGWIVRTRSREQFERLGGATAALLVALVVVAGHFGGDLTHGSGYLTQYAPDFLRRLAGLAPSGPRLTTIDAADPYVDVVAPVLEQQCVECHSSSKQKGGLDVSSYASLMKGGGDGPVIAAGSAKTSDLIRRVSLPQTADDYMPKGKTPLSADQIAVLSWWIDSGAKTGVKVLALNPPKPIQSIIQSELQPAGAESEAAQGGPNVEQLKAIAAAAQKNEQEAEKAEAQAPQEADPQVVARLVAGGFMARAISVGDAHLIVSPAVPGNGLSASGVQALGNANNQIVELNLAHSELSDDAIAPIAQLTALTHLRLDDNKLTDKAVQVLGSLPQLVELNLVSNAGITDASIPTLAGIKSLRRVYVWQTGITPAGVTKLHQQRPDLQIDDGDMTVSPTTSPPAAAGT